VTFCAGIALVPAVLVTVWLTGRLVGQARAAELGRSLADALPSALGAPQVAQAAVSAGLRLPCWVAAAALPPASRSGAWEPRSDGAGEFGERRDDAGD
jgi:membrane protein